MHVRVRLVGRCYAARTHNAAMSSPVPPSARPRGRPVLLVALILLFAVVLPFVAGRVVLHFWMPERPESVPAATIAEIVREAQSRVATHTPGSVPWKSMDARRLRGLLQSERFETAPEDVRLLLVDQAAAWDVLHFDRPSDILAQWQRLGLSGGLELPPEQRLGRIEGIWVATNDWSDEAGAALALWQCLPDWSWGQQAMRPLEYAQQRGAGWTVDQSAGTDFGSCVRKLRERAPFVAMQAPDWHKPAPDTERGRRAANVLLKKLPALIRDIGCSGTGADDCVLLLKALASLGADHATLAPVLARMDSTFQPPGNLATLLADPVAPFGSPRPTGDAVPAWASQDVRSKLLQTWSYLDARVRALAVPTTPDDPLPKGEPGATIGRLFDVTVALRHIEQVGGGTTSPARDPVEGAWSAVERAAQAQPAWREALRSRGDAAAAAPGCAPLAGLPADPLLTPPPEFWLGFAVRKLVTVGTGCGRMPADALASHLAGDADDPILNRLAPLAGREDAARAHLEILNATGGRCPMGRDLLGLCAWLRDADIAIAKDGAQALPLKVGQAWIEVSHDKPPAPVDRAASQAAPHPDRAKAMDGAIARLPAGSEWMLERQWLAPGGSGMAALLSRNASVWDDPPGVPVHARTVLLLVGARGERIVNVPAGMEENLSTLSDLDGDGNPELWSEADEGECDGEDLKPGVDCAIHRAWMSGEVFGNEVATFLRGPWPAPPLPLHPQARAATDRP